MTRITLDGPQYDLFISRIKSQHRFTDASLSEENFIIPLFLLTTDEPMIITRKGEVEA